AEHQALCEEYPDDLDVARACHLNSNGFYDDDEFLATPSLTAVTPRVLMLGDSFTYGMTADLGRSWVEVVEAGLEDGEVWNTGLPGNGTGNVIAGLQAWGPVMQPDLAVYGFYMNDIDGSLYPLADRYVMLEIPDWGLPFDRVAVTQWFVNEEGVLEQLTMDQLLYRGLLGYEAPRNGIEAILGQTRLGTLLLRAIDVVRESVGQRWELAIAQTRANLLELQQTAAELDVPLLVLLIPSPVEAEVLSERYTVARSLLNELDIAYVDPRPLLEVNDYAYVGDPEDIHWNNSGHAIIGELMLACVQAISDGAPLSVCQEIAAQHVEQAGG
ncbi:MAG: hypothetical protein JW910_12720, partial [Anaerolineae bacterium]|nr:hypothetical protein [Anaerolineae bacterium]